MIKEEQTKPCYPETLRVIVMLTAQWHTDAEAQGEEHAETGLHL